MDSIGPRRASVAALVDRVFKQSYSSDLEARGLCEGGVFNCTTAGGFTPSGALLKVGTRNVNLNFAPTPLPHATILAHAMRLSRGLFCEYFRKRCHSVPRPAWTLFS